MFSSQRLAGAARDALAASRPTPPISAADPAPLPPPTPRRRGREQAASAMRRAALRSVEQLERRVFLSAALPDQPVMGINVDAVTDFNTAWPFEDAMKESRPWISHAYNTATRIENFNDSTPVAVDANGWPTQLASWTNDQGQLIRQRVSTLLFRDIGDKYPAGVYRAEWEGSGTMVFGYAASVQSSGVTADGKNFAVLNVDPAKPGVSGIWVKINDMDPANPVRNIHVWMPNTDTNGDGVADTAVRPAEWQPGDTSGASPFNQTFVDRLKPFNALRFMEWGDTNGSQLRTWDQRRRIDEARQNGDGRGVAYEYMIELANEVQADPWFCLPYAADDDYVRNMATLVLNNLSADRKIYVEWSNEIWNFASGFRTYYWATDQLAKPENAAYNADPSTARWKFYADQIKRDFDIWTDVFTQAGQQDRLVRVVAGQAANPSITDIILQNMEGKFDAVSCAGYFGLTDTQTASFNASTTSSDIARAMIDNVPASLKNMQRTSDLAAKYSQQFGRDIKYVNYEWGSSASANGRTVVWQQALNDAMTNPLVYEAYDDLLRGAKNMGVDAMFHFTYVYKPNKFGTWGLLQYQDEPIANAPKYRAVLDATTGYMYRPEFSVSTGDRFMNEFDQSSATFQVTRDGDPTADVDVSFGFTGGTAGAADVQPIPATIHFAAGEVTKSVTVTTLNDSLLEGQETLNLTLTAGPGYKVDYKKGSASIVINDDEGSVTWGVPIQNASFESGNLSGWTLTSASAANKVVVVSSVAGAPNTPRNGGYFMWGGGTDNGQGGGPNPAGLSQRIDLSAHAQRIDWGFANLNFTGWGAGEGTGLDAGYLEAVFYDANGQPIGPPVTSNKADSLKSWTALALNARVPAGARGVDLRAMTSRVVGTNITSAGVDDMAATLTYSLLPTVQISAGPAAAEGGANSGFTFTRYGPDPGGPLTVKYAVGGTATAGNDYAALTGTAVIPAGQTSVTIPVSVVDDQVEELAETVVVTVTSGTTYSAGPANTGTVTVNDNDKPFVSIAATDAAASELNLDKGEFVVTRASDLLGSALTVRYTVGGTATSGADFQPLGGTVTIPAGQQSALITLTPIDDQSQERPETVTLTLSADAAYSVGTPAGATATIADDDLPVVTIEATDPSAAEQGRDPAVFTVRRASDLLDAPLVVKLFVDGTAAEGQDYNTLPRTVTIPAGQTSATVTLTPVDDLVAEGNEAVVLTVVADPAYAPGAQVSASATIADNDSPPRVAEVRLAGSSWSPDFLAALNQAGLGDGGYSVPADGQLKDVPWSNLNRVSIRFNQDVVVDQSDLSVRGLNVPSYATTAFSYDPATFTATWTLGTTVRNDKLLLDLDGTTAGAVKSRLGQALDGEWANAGGAGAAFPSGNGAAGGNFRFQVNVLPADATRDGVVNSTDANNTRLRLGAAVGKPNYSVFYDFDGNGEIDVMDVATSRQYMSKTLPNGEPALVAGVMSLAFARKSVAAAAGT